VALPLLEWGLWVLLRVRFMEPARVSVKALKDCKMRLSVRWLAASAALSAGL
jgi:hypothetical protein